MLFALSSMEISINFQNINILIIIKKVLTILVIAHEHTNKHLFWLALNMP